MPKLETHIVAKNNYKKHPNSTDSIFRVARKPHPDDPKAFDYFVYASEHDRQWNSHYYTNALVSVESDGNKLTITKRMHCGEKSKTYVLEYDEAQELFLALWLRYEDRNSYTFATYKKKKNGKRTSSRSKPRSNAGRRKQRK